MSTKNNIGKSVIVKMNNGEELNHLIIGVRQYNHLTGNVWDYIGVPMPDGFNKNNLSQTPNENTNLYYFNEEDIIRDETLGENLLITEQINEFDTPSQSTKNYLKHKEILGSLSVSLIHKSIDSIDLLTSMLIEDEHKHDSFELSASLANVIKELKVENTCPHCGLSMYKSDLPQYDFVCVNCDENF